MTRRVNRNHTIQSVLVGQEIEAQNSCSLAHRVLISEAMPTNSFFRTSCWARLCRVSSTGESSTRKSGCTASNRPIPRCAKVGALHGAESPSLRIKKIDEHNSSFERFFDVVCPASAGAFRPRAFALPLFETTLIFCLLGTLLDAIKI